MVDILLHDATPDAVIKCMKLVGFNSAGETSSDPCSTRRMRIIRSRTDAGVWTGRDWC